MKIIFIRNDDGKDNNENEQTIPQLKRQFE